MAAVKFGHDTPEWNIMGDFFHLCERNFGIEDTDAYWQKVQEDAKDFLNKHQDHLFAQRLVYAMQEYLEITYIERKKQLDRMSEKSEPNLEV